MLFEKIYLLGEGRVARQCFKIARDFFNQEVLFVDDKKLDIFFKNIKNSLIISANNFYIFKKECVENNTIINYHNSLLPKHKGVNAHMWSIWEKDSKSGISWHKVDCSIDTGAILVQKEIILDEKITALKLLSLQNNLAINSFKEALQNLICNNFTPQKISHLGGGYHYKKDLPNDGYLDLSWDFEKISRFLRAMNTHNIKIINNDEIKELKFYTINKKITLKTKDNENIIVT